MLAVLERTGVMPELLAKASAVPEGCGQLWDDFLELHSSRSPGFSGATRISFGDVLAWQELRGVRLASWELDAIRRADDQFMAWQAEQVK